MDAAYIRLSHLRQMAASMSEARLTEINLQGSGWTVRMRFSPSAPPAPASASPTGDGGDMLSPVTPPAATMLTVSATLPGRFVACYPGDTEPYVRAGDRVRYGDLLGLQQSGMMLLPLRSPADGRVSEIIAGGQQVEYGSLVAVVQVAEQHTDESSV